MSFSAVLNFVVNKENILPYSCHAILDISRNNLCNAYVKKNLILKCGKLIYSFYVHDKGRNVSFQG